MGLSGNARGRRGGGKHPASESGVRGRRWGTPDNHAQRSASPVAPSSRPCRPQPSQLVGAWLTGFLRHRTAAGGSMQQSFGALDGDPLPGTDLLLDVDDVLATFPMRETDELQQAGGAPTGDARGGGCVSPVGCTRPMTAPYYCSPRCYGAPSSPFVPSCQRCDRTAGSRACPGRRRRLAAWTLGRDWGPLGEAREEGQRRLVARLKGCARCSACRKVCGHASRAAFRPPGRQRAVLRLWGPFHRGLWCASPGGF